MKIKVDNLHDKIVLTLSEVEFLAIRAAMRGATGDDKRRGHEYEHFYGQDKGFMVSLYNKLDSFGRPHA